MVLSPGHLHNAFAAPRTEVRVCFALGVRGEAGPSRPSYPPHLDCISFHGVIIPHSTQF